MQFAVLTLQQQDKRFRGLKAIPQNAPLTLKQNTNGHTTESFPTFFTRFSATLLRNSYFSHFYSGFRGLGSPEAVV
jgi:hypothetical protein